ncbi:hypothetical protein [Mesomycoplasma molare]|uniref:Lipoprotein n=1 Tax=Mesomycoplasma molare TaxID=171288 RepID=A0ABY5TV86_9BACT|nr:hypothetical protein [Mesomycoplasma molare]UWD34579.1 hypothetical protein NX772_01990 [Mesomycoplasma molare]
MKKKFLISTCLAIPFILFTSCISQQHESEIERNRDEGNENNKNVIEIAKKLEIQDISKSIYDKKIKWDNFVSEFNNLNIESKTYFSDFEKLINKNWVLFISNLDYFRFKQQPNNKWFLHKETEEAKYSNFYKHNIGLTKNDEESLPHHTHVKFPTNLLNSRTFKTLSYTSKKFISEKTGNPSIYVSFGRIVINFEKRNDKIYISPNFLYFVNNKGSYSGSLDEELLDIVIGILNIPENGFSQELSNIIDRTTKEIGYPANLFLESKNNKNIR